MATLPFSANDFHRCAQALIATTRELSARGWTPATSSNFSLRLDDRHAVITVSGRDKGRLTEADFMVVDWRGRAVASEHRPSAETLLHTRLYERFEDVGCVLHTHSHAQTVASRLFAEAGSVRLAGYELLKAFPGQDSHDTAVELPVLPNSQDMPALADQVDRMLDDHSLPGYLIDGHGLYAWGADLDAARRHLEAFDFLLAAELDLRRLRASV
ncbi:methylthioribulose 1-phosphate dehydratase [Pseudomarimonas salicorniae]|uniref:Methylthioribulose-1-phosphate dehydratase n=1 Tax=Pseudomarimonas salicorniae TaxID=2933270 RepID=A0ABT0GLJ0_9GAMM|nr:methylthioribulose 1-phosphate dehydratase [Lysobacter sp. CAU 1642]MCK7595413.1 methylthioribulose 1-phosphate dehydratase [Lysobacter sp. CAU 1642]